MFFRGNEADLVPRVLAAILELLAGMGRLGLLELFPKAAASPDDRKS
jgi:hypothetical protein